MIGPACLLIYGTDSKLLDTRRMVLEYAGHHVLAQLDPLSAAPYLSELNFDVLILCHTLSPEDCHRVASLAYVRWPAIRTITLSRGWQTQPTTLLATVAGALAEVGRAEVEFHPKPDCKSSTSSPSALQTH